MKAIKYKEQNEALQDTIKEHLKIQDELQAKLKAEAKANAGKDRALKELLYLSPTRPTINFSQGANCKRPTINDFL